MAKFTKVPSQAANGLQTFSDSLVGTQITDGSSQLTNTNFALDKVIPEKDSKNFKTSPFSDFLTLDSLKEETSAVTTQDGSSEKKEKIKFRGGRDDAAKSLYGSLKERLNVSIGKIVNKFPAALFVDGTIPVRTSEYTAQNISYDTLTQTTEFEVEKSGIYNPFDVILVAPQSLTISETNNQFRNFYSTFIKYVIEYSGNTYNILSYTEPTTDGNLIIKVSGKPFGTNTEITDNFLIRPNNGVTEEFFNNLDDLEELLLNRETNPKYEASFKVPRDSSDGNATDIVSIEIVWPLAIDGWNLQTIGADFEDYITKLSDVADEIDDYKSNLVVRFLASPQLFEFDTNDKKSENIFQLYGQSFDKVKKYIDNIAFMRHVSYDGINNVPDILLKNLSQTLGLNTTNLFDQKSLEETTYTREDSVYGGLAVGKTLVDAEHEFYRRLLVNLSYIYKSKGTRSSIEFFLKFLGAPEPMIKINEYVYDVKTLPSNDVQDDLYNLIQGTKVNVVITGYTNGSYLTGTTTGTTVLTRDDYPIDGDGLPRKVTNETEDIFFQKGSGWNDLTLDHRSSDVLDIENSITENVRVKTIKTKPKDYTYGEDYFNYFRTLSGLDYGFTLEPRIDNVKVSVVESETDSKLILNRKNIGVYLSPAQCIDYDIYRQSRDLNLTFGNLTPQNDLTFEEYLNDAMNQVVTDSNSAKYYKSYYTLETTYNEYITESSIIPYNFNSVNEFINNMSPYWIQIVEQFIPSSTLWTGGNLVENNTFNRSKHTYLKPRYGVTSNVSYNSDSYQCDGYEYVTPLTPTPSLSPSPTPTLTPTPTITPVACNFTATFVEV
jgi:hypothetical protein